MKKILYFVFIVFSTLYLFSCSEERYFPGKIYSDNGDTIPEKGELKDVNIAKGGTASSGSQQDATHGPDLLVNGLIQGSEEYFGTSQTLSDHGEWVQIILTNKQNINSIWLYPRDANSGFPQDFKLKVSVDAKNWTTVADITNYMISTADPQKFNFSSVKASYIRLEATKLATANNMWTNWQTVYYFQLKEIEVYLLNSTN